MTLRQAFAVVIAVQIICCSDVFAQEGADAVARGRTPIEMPGSQRYGNSWALIIGINYEDRQFTDSKDRLSLPPLANAERDAESIHDFLVSHYGYTEGKNIKLLTGPAAEAKAINEEVSNLIDETRVKSDDSIFIFFAGHGHRLSGDQRDRAAIFPFDVKLSAGKPIDRYIRLYSDLFQKLRDSKARHKLVVLDSCYSGEILKAGFHSPSEIVDRGSPRLFAEPTFQAIASCRAFQVSSDGKRTLNSPFTSAFLKALQHLPAREQYTDGLWVDRLFAYLYPELKGQVDEQEPQFAILEGDGEFRFFPKADADFTKFRTDLDERKLLNAILTSPEGNWWFDEMPWFIPGLRESILKKVTPNRSAGALIGRDELRDITREVVAEGSKLRPGASTKSSASTSGCDDSSAQDTFVPRCKHAKMLLDSEGTQRLKEELEQIAKDLECKPEKDLEAADLHFKAVVLHALKKEKQASEVYTRAVEKYRHTGKELKRSEKALLALCLADQGELLLRQEAPAGEAARMFRDADRQFGNEAPAAFRVFVLCRESDAWSRSNRWAKADDRLLEARRIVETSDSDHLAAFVYSQLAWARMIQWKVVDAEYWFTASNKMLGNVYGKVDRSVSPQTEATDVPLEKPERSPSDSATEEQQHIYREDADVFATGPDFRDWEREDAKIAYLHNLHGLAMVQRFKGKPKYAAQKYRWLAGEVEATLTHLRQAAVNAEGDAEVKLYARLVNTLERLGDCNLFGPPDERDLKEALDDYRRALSRCHRVSKDETKGPRIQLLYKQALTLAMPSQIQDTSLALSICKAADELYGRTFQTQTLDSTSSVKPQTTDVKPKASGMLLAFGELTTKIVTLLHRKEKRGLSHDPNLLDPVAELRRAVYRFRAENGPDLHRDQLELCLFASKVLLDYGDEGDGFHLNEDVELLLSFCRLPLAPHESQVQKPATSDQLEGETCAYLRPFYDSAMRAKIRLAPAAVHVKDLLEIQWEATCGRTYVKPENPVPTLAVYILDGAPYLLYDVPLGSSGCVSLKDDFTADQVCQACGTSANRLPLPQEVVKALRESCGSVSRAPVERRWKDPIRGISDYKDLLITENPKKVWRRVRSATCFPFDLPAGCAEISMPLPTATTAATAMPGGH